MVLSKLEKIVMLLIHEKCINKESVLISPNQLIISLLPKYQITAKELDKIINNLVLDGYIDVINSDNKGNHIYCISLKMKGIAFKREMLVQRKSTKNDVIKKIVLAALGVVVTLLLRALFS